MKVVQLSDRANLATENLCHVQTILKDLDHMNVCLDNSVYGMSTHERIHFMQIFQRYQKRLIDIIQNEVPHVDKKASAA